MTDEEYILELSKLNLDIPVPPLTLMERAMETSNSLEAKLALYRKLAHEYQKDRFAARLARAKVTR